jgi:hypothetical protein
MDPDGPEIRKEGMRDEDRAADIAHAQQRGEELFDSPPWPR